MKTNFGKIRDAMFAVLLGALPLGNALADDIDIYVGAASDLAGVRPNILFVLDTSGSMATNVVTQIPYDPTVTYTGNCDPAYYYVSRDNNPSCDDDDWWDWGWGGDDQAQQIPASLFVCNAALPALGSTGYYQDRFAQWRQRNDPDDSEWDDDVDEDDRITECADDDGVHGQNTGDATVYPADEEDGPYTTDEDDSIRWNNFDVHTAYSANYLNWMNDDSTTTSQSRIAIMQEVFKDTLDSISNVNVGLMRFDADANGGMVVHEIANLSTARDDLKAEIDDMTAAGNTPLSETLYEAALYYMGKDVDYGLGSEDQFGSRPSVAESRSGNTYISPMAYQCQKNFIVYLTDGEPTSDDGAEDEIEDLPGNANNCSGNCMDELADYLYDKDLSTALGGTQNVITYTIGFATDQTLLSDTASKGGGKYYTADNTAELTNALTSIVAEVLSVNTTFTAPAVSVNAFNRTVHLDQLFFTIFKPNERPHWNGNLKRFDLGKENPTDTEVQILDLNNKPAVDPNTGFFKETAVSHWTNADQSPDGGEAGIGGAAGDISLPREIYTYTGTALDLTDDSNDFNESNTAITKADLNIAAATDAYRTELLQWARGVDLEDVDDDGFVDDARRVMGDPLHSKPVVVTYGGTTADPDFTVFMTTNDGYLHAVNGETGAEHFAFIPKEVWSKLDTLYENDAGSDSKVYGLDSPVTAWVYDENNNGIIEVDEENDDHVYVYFGQRRGGKNYYALDVTNRAAPKFMWRIDDTTSGYGELGQSWSQPRMAKVNVDGTVKDVLIFGGGYDVAQDATDNWAADTEGRAIFMTDALTGALIWSAGPASSGADLELTYMKNSIPAEIRVIDMDADGLSDRMYASDTGGRIFRFDIINGQPAATLVKGGRIASLGSGDMASPTIAETRKFFYPPDAALIVDGTKRYINLAIGSGNQDNPLGKVNQDRLYSIRDWHVFDVPSSYPQTDEAIITPSDLHDATDNLVVEGTEAQKTAAIEQLDTRDGWYIDLQNSAGTNEGEKSLSEATTIQGNIFYTTFTPVTATQTDGCAPSQGVARAYLISARDATAVENFDGLGEDDALTKEDRAMNLTRGGIPPEVTILFPESADGEPLALVGPEKLPAPLTNVPVRTYWYENDADE